MPGATGDDISQTTEGRLNSGDAVCDKGGELQDETEGDQGCRNWKDGRQSIQ